MSTNVIKSKKPVNERIRGDRLHFWGVLLWPIIQFAIFYVYINLDAFVIAFQDCDPITLEYSFGQDIFVNFNRFFSEVAASNEIPRGILLSFTDYAFSLVVGMPITLYLSYIMYKKVPAHKFFKIMLYVPSIISSTVWVLLYTQIMENAVPAVVFSLTGNKIGGVISNIDSSFPAILYFQMWYSLGSGTLLYIANMSGIPEERSEAMRVDGAGSIREFWHMVLPSIWPLITLGLYTGIPEIITRSMGMFTFYGYDAPSHLRTFGYWLEVRKYRASSNVFDLPYIAAIGMLQGFITIPVMFLVRHLLGKFGPKED